MHAETIVPVTIGTEISNFRSDIDPAKHLFEHARQPLAMRAESLVAIHDNETSAAIVISAVGSFQAADTAKTESGGGTSRHANAPPTTHGTNPGLLQSKGK